MVSADDRAMSTDKFRPKGIHILRKPSAAPFLILLSIFTIFSQVHADQFKSTGTVYVYCSPGGGTTAAIVNELNSANAEILVLV